MRSIQLKTLFGGLAVILAMLACSFTSPALPTLATFPPVPTATDTASPVPATVAPAIPAATDTATALLATNTPAVQPLPVLRQIPVSQHYPRKRPANRVQP